MEYSEIKLSNNYIRLDGKELASNYVVGPYNGISTSKIPCVIFQEFVERENIKKICTLTLDYDSGVSEILKHIFKTKLQILNINAFNWNTIKDSDKTIITKELCDRGYLFETKDNTLTATLGFVQEQPVKIPTVLATPKIDGILGENKFSSYNLEIDDIFDKAVRYIGNHTKTKTFFINIGAMDGKTYDELSGYVALFDFNGLYVEPIPYIYDILKSNFSKDNLFENSAITTYDGEIEMLTIQQEPIEQGKIHQCFRGMSAVYPLKNGLGSAGDKATVDKYGVKITVPCLTFSSLLKKHNINQFDILKIDAEGHDWDIFKGVDLDKYRPSVIRLEWINLSEENKQELLDKFLAHNYVYEMIYGDITAITEELHLMIIGKENKEEFFQDGKILTPQQSGIKKKYRLECIVETDLDVKDVLQNTFDNVVVGKLTPIYEAIPIKLNNGTFKALDYSLFVDSDGITLIFDYGENSRESGVEYSLKKNVDYVVEQWLETLDSEQLYILAQLTFTRKFG